jgi:hypothetical protein
MSVPLDNLYHYIESVAKAVYGDVVVMHFYPHGAKNLKNLNPLRHYEGWASTMVLPHVICNDQEPLDFDYYNTVPKDHEWVNLLVKYNCYYQDINLGRFVNVYNKKILLHSEKRSSNIDKYSAVNFIPVYYFSHAMIALDWFRYAQHIEQEKQVTKMFLIYNRGWSGTREYRLKFLDLLIEHKLIDQCRTNLCAVDQCVQQHYRDYVFSNPVWQPHNSLEQHATVTQVPSHYSAVLDIEDYEHTCVEVVLETLFDDTRWHLTEKALRPLAGAQPFILAATAGSLEYLRSYGFETYSSVWDESYDSITDPQKRLQAIVELMQNMANWDPQTRQNRMIQAQAIADRNKKYFFSQEFFNRITEELIENLHKGLHELETTNDSSFLIQTRMNLSKHPELRDIITGRQPHPGLKNTVIPKHEIMQVLSLARRYYQRKKQAHS